MKSRSLCATLWALSFCALLASCSGGSDDDRQLDIVVRVNGVTVAGPLHESPDQPITVASGDQVDFLSDSSVSYALALTTVEASDSSHDDRSFQATLTSVVGGSAEMQIVSSEHASDRMSVKLIVQPQQFANRTWALGETLVQDEIYKEATYRRARQVIGTADDGSYIIETDTDLAYRFTDFYDIDSNHYRYRADDLSGSDSPEHRVCWETPGRLIKSFPLFVGRQWDSEWDAECSLEYRNHHVATNRVAAYETVTVPAGSFPALHIISDRTVTDEFGQVGRERTECWWSVEFQQDVRCDESYFQDGAPVVYRSTQAVQLAGQTVATSAISPARAQPHLGTR